MADIMPKDIAPKKAAAQPKAYQFKARPLSKAVMESVGDLGVTHVRKRPPTHVKEFKLSSSRPSSAQRRSAEKKLSPKPAPKPAIRKKPARRTSGSPKWSCRRGTDVPRRGSKVLKA